MQAKRQKKPKAGKPVFIVRSARLGGLDYLHISMIALIIILIAFAFALAYYKPGPVLQNCPYGIVNGTCVSLRYNSSQVVDAVGRVLASYAASNTSLSVLPYYSMVNSTSVSYLPETKEWIAIVPYMDPFYNNETLNVSFVFTSNLTLEHSFLSMVGPAGYSNDSVVALGTVSLAGRSMCAYSKPMPVYFVTDPYVPGFINYTEGALSLSSRYGNSINASYYFIASSYAAGKYQQYGVSRTQELNRYLICASRQAGFPSFVSNLSMAYTGSPLSNSTLHDIALGSGLNMSAFSTCMGNASKTLDAETTLAAFYRISSLPSYVINCRYSSIPGMEVHAIDYALSRLS